MDTNIRNGVETTLTDLQNPISKYDTILDSTGEETISILSFLEGIRIGTWQDIVLPIRDKRIG